MSGVLRKLPSSIVAAAKTTTVQKANIISGPPRFRVPLTEKVAIGSVMIALTIAPAAWVMMNIKAYRTRECD